MGTSKSSSLNMDRSRLTVDGSKLVILAKYRKIQRIQTITAILSFINLTEPHGNYSEIFLQCSEHVYTILVYNWAWNPLYPDRPGAILTQNLADITGFLKISRIQTIQNNFELH